ncbi:MAG: hypothetical protein ACT4P5_06535 [Armatimonadota bacterium]
MYPTTQMAPVSKTRLWAGLILSALAVLLFNAGEGAESDEVDAVGVRLYMEVAAHYV